MLRRWKEQWRRRSSACVGRSLIQQNDSTILFPPFPRHSTSRAKNTLSFVNWVTFLFEEEIQQLTRPHMLQKFVSINFLFFVFGNKYTERTFHEIFEVKEDATKPPIKKRKREFEEIFLLVAAKARIWWRIICFLLRKRKFHSNSTWNFVHTQNL